MMSTRLAILELAVKSVLCQVAIMIGSSVFTLLCKKFTVESFMRSASIHLFVIMHYALVLFILLTE